MAAIFHFYHNTAYQEKLELHIKIKNTYDTNMTEILKKRLNTVIYLSFTDDDIQGVSKNIPEVLAMTRESIVGFS